jgi:hypothetical protein
MSMTNDAWDRWCRTWTNALPEANKPDGCRGIGAGPGQMLCLRRISRMRPPENGLSCDFVPCFWGITSLGNGVAPREILDTRGIGGSVPDPGKRFNPKEISSTRPLKTWSRFDFSVPFFNLRRSCDAKLQSTPAVQGCVPIFFISRHIELRLLSAHNEIDKMHLQLGTIFPARNPERLRLGASSFSVQGSRCRVSHSARNLHGFAPKSGTLFA